MKVFAAIAYAGVIAFFAYALPGTSGPLVLALFFLILAAPSGVFGTYLATLRRIHSLSLWSPDSVAVRWFSGPWLRLIFGILVAFMTAALLVIRLAVPNLIDIFLLSACLALLGLVWYFYGNRLRKQVQPLYREGWPLLWAAAATAALMIVIDPALRIALVTYDAYENLREAIDAMRQQPSWLGESAVAALASGWGRDWAGLEHWFMARLIAEPGIVALPGVFLSGLSRFPLYFAACITLCAFLVPMGEYRRILLHSSPDLKTETVSPWRIANAGGLLAILVLFIYLPLVGVMESAIEKHPATRSPEATLTRAVELIGDSYYPAGTHQEIVAIGNTMAEDTAAAVVAIDAALDSGFAQVRDNVDLYLDWYYSLPGEWGRLASLLMGNIEEHLTEKLAETFAIDAALQEFEQVLAAALADDARRQQAFRQRATETLEARRIDIGAEDEAEVVLRADLEDLLSLPHHAGITSLEQRLGVTAATTGLSGVLAAAVTRQVLTRVAARGTFRAAATAITRLASARAASSGGGAAAGAVAGGVVGSFVPVIGTAIGAAVGGVVGGISVGAGAEFLILKLEELWSREGHRAELLAAIDEAERDFRQRYNLDSSTGHAR
ncbi:MAG: hypothetical protein JJU15_03555 [Pararhodobacter sp.]|nr:hypothetical protein [Pararhodobacter sp.]